MDREGGCLCGAVRYRLSGTPIDAGFCHCRLCQKSSGAPLMAWLTLPAGGFEYLQGDVSVFHSSESHQREFCSRCGTQLAFRLKRNPTTVDVTICSLVDSSAIAPEYHIWCRSKVGWLHVDDALPQFPDAGPDVP